MNIFCQSHQKGHLHALTFVNFLDASSAARRSNSIRKAFINGACADLNFTKCSNPSHLWPFNNRFEETCKVPSSIFTASLSSLMIAWIFFNMFNRLYEGGTLIMGFHFYRRQCNDQISLENNFALQVLVETAWEKFA